MNIFIKCGGNDYEYYKDHLNIDASWQVYVFDPILDSHELQLSVHHEKCVIWTETTILPFCYDTVAPESSSLYHLHNRHAKCRTTDVPCIDFSQFLETKRNATIYCVMDVEGAEYAILRHLIAQGTIRHIHHLWIRWHDHTDEDADAMMAVLHDLIRVEAF